MGQPPQQPQEHELRYQWLKGGAALAGADGPTLAVDPRDAAQYACTVTDAATGRSATVDVATFPPFVKADEEGLRSLCEAAYLVPTHNK